MTSRPQHSSSASAQRLAGQGGIACQAELLHRQRVTPVRVVTGGDQDEVGLKAAGEGDRICVEGASIACIAHAHGQGHVEGEAPASALPVSSAAPVPG